MLVIEATHPRQDRVDGELELPFESRQKSRLRTRLKSGEEVGLFLPHGHILRGGDCLRANDARIVRVVAAVEALMEVRCSAALGLMRAAYHLGNRHVAVQIGEGWLRLLSDHVLEQMLHGLNAQVVELTAPFEPEAGAYAAGHRHHAMGATHAGIIHDFQDYKKN